MRNYGGLFIGHHAAEVLGDYGAGPNHTLPTGGTARSFGGLSVLTFLRVRSWLNITDLNKVKNKQKEKEKRKIKAKRKDKEKQQIKIKAKTKEKENQEEKEKKKPIEKEEIAYVCFLGTRYGKGCCQIGRT